MERKPNPIGPAGEDEVALAISPERSSRPGNMTPRMR
jgi:hypothetical protein